MTVEELSYAIVAKEGDFEIRQYAPHIVAETTVTGGFGWVGNVAFQRLAGYIFGKNRRRDTIAMTAPVLQEARTETSSETIAMTAPVLQEPAGKAWNVTFVMPAEYKMETLPEPMSPKVHLRERPAQLMAALRYSGTWGKGRFDKHRRKLEALIQRRGYRITGPAIFARYDPPMTPWFRRRNEVMIPVAPVEGQS